MIVSNSAKLHYPWIEFMLKHNLAIQLANSLEGSLVSFSAFIRNTYLQSVLIEEQKVEFCEGNGERGLRISSAVLFDV